VSLPREPLLVAVDVGGTEIKGSVVSGVPRSTDPVRRWPTPQNDPPAAVQTVLDAVAALCREAGAPAGVGLVVPGLVDEHHGTAVFSENVGWHDVPFRALLAAQTGLPVGFGHDVRAGGLAERELGAARAVDDLLFMPIGTGISGAVIVAGHPVSNPYAGEIGHVDVCGGEDCVCGARGCLEAVASAAAIARRYTQASGIAVRGAVDVLRALDRGDVAAARVWDDAIAAIARALIIYASLLAPDVIVIGGGLSRAGPALFDPLRVQLHRLVRLQREPRIVPSALGAESARFGAAVLARRALDEQPIDPSSSPVERIGP
jgi:glucokinase